LGGSGGAKKGPKERRGGEVVQRKVRARMKTIVFRNHGGEEAAKTHIGCTSTGELHSDQRCGGSNPASVRLRVKEIEH